MKLQVYTKYCITKMICLFPILYYEMLVKLLVLILIKAYMKWFTWNITITYRWVINFVAAWLPFKVINLLRRCNEITGVHKILYHKKWFADSLFYIVKYVIHKRREIRFQPNGEITFFPCQFWTRLISLFYFF